MSRKSTLLAGAILLASLLNIPLAPSAFAQDDNAKESSTPETESESDPFGAEPNGGVPEGFDAFRGDPFAELNGGDPDGGRENPFADPFAETTPPAPAANEQEIKILALRFLPAKDAAQILMSMYGEFVHVSPVPSSNQIVLRGFDKQWLKAAEDLMMRLDKREEDLANAQVEANTWPRKTSKFDDEAIAAAKRYREQAKLLGEGHPRLVALRNELMAIVNQSFDERQHINTQRIARLEERLAALKQKVEQREESRKRAINQRVDELLKGVQPKAGQTRDLQLDPSSFQVAVSASAARPDAADPTTTAARGASPLDLVALFIRSRADLDEAQAELEAAHERLKGALDRLEGARATDSDFSTGADDNTDMFERDVRDRNAGLRKANIAFVTAQRLQSLLKTRIRSQAKLLMNRKQHAELSWSTATRALDRARELQERNAISRSELDRIHAAANQAERELTEASVILQAFEEATKDIDED